MADTMTDAVREEMLEVMGDIKAWIDKHLSA